MSPILDRLARESPSDVSGAIVRVPGTLLDVAVFDKRQQVPFQSIRVPIGDAIECMVSTLSGTMDDVLLCSTVFGPFVGPGDCHTFSAPDRLPPSDELLLHLPRRMGAKTVLFGSKSSGPIASVHDGDVALTARLLKAARRTGIDILDHVVVSEGMFRFMSESTNLWSSLPPDR